MKNGTPTDSAAIKLITIFIHHILRTKNTINIPTIIFNTLEISKLGIEPDDNKLTKEYIYDKFKNKRLPIKTLLLDQTIISGLGNIYADEVAFASKVNPLRLGNTIKLEEEENSENQNIFVNLSQEENKNQESKSIDS